MPSLTSSSSSLSSTTSSSIQQQQPARSQSTTAKDELSNGSSSPTAIEESVTVVRMRNKPFALQNQQPIRNGTVFGANNNSDNGNNSINNNSRSALQRGLDVLNEITPEDDGSEEIRKLDSQLDHLNHYMDKVEERIKAHNEKLMDVLRQQKEEREKRRRSFHERIALNQQEDDDFQRQISTLLNRVDISKNRASMYDIISQMDIPKANGQ